MKHDGNKDDKKGGKQEIKKKQNQDQVNQSNKIELKHIIGNFKKNDSGSSKQQVAVNKPR